MVIQFYNDPETGLPHIYRHGVAEHEADEIIPAVHALLAEHATRRDGHQAPAPP